MTKIYVAGASKEIETVRGYMKRLREKGFEVTYDWVKTIDDHAGKANDGVEDAQQIAEAELDGVLASTLFWLLAPKAPTIGAWIELGAGIMMGNTVIISGLDDVGRNVKQRTIFAALADFVFDHHETAFQYIANLSGRERAALG